ncbi:hypothetical protein [Halpernia sp. GG3]
MKKLFLSMALVGFSTFAFAQQSQSTTNNMKRGDMKQNMAMHQQKQMDKMKSDLNLNDDQIMKIKALQDERMEARKNKMAGDKTEKMEKRKDAREEMKKILTPEQYTKWESHMKEKMEKGKDNRMMKNDKSSMRMESK